jgi:hypothetical protein
MKLFHIIAISHRREEIREEYPGEADRERTIAKLMRRYETVFCLRSFNGQRDEWQRRDGP